MRIALDARKLGDFGIGSYIAGLVEALARARPQWRFQLIGDPGPKPPFAELANAEWIADDSPKYSLSELVRVSRHVRHTRADLFHSPHYVYPVGVRCPGVVTIHDCIHQRFVGQLPRPLGVLPRRLGALYATAMMRHAGRAARHVIAVSRSTAQDLRALVGLPAERITVVPNGCDAAFRRPPNSAERAAAAALDPPARFFLFVGNPKPHKNLRRLLCAFSGAAERIDAHLLLAGVESAALPGDFTSPRVRALGLVDAEVLRGLYDRALALCSPSLYEGFGLPVLEAMAAGTPVIAADAGALPELVGEAGLLVDPQSTDEIADSLVRLAEDPALRQELAERGSIRAAPYTWEATAAATLRVYEQALRQEATT